MVTIIYWLQLYCPDIGWYKYDDNISGFDITRYRWIHSSFEWINTFIDPTIQGLHCRHRFQSGQPELLIMHANSSAPRSKEDALSTAYRSKSTTEIYTTWNILAVIFCCQKGFVFHTTHRNKKWTYFCAIILLAEK